MVSVAVMTDHTDRRRPRKIRCSIEISASLVPHDAPVPLLVSQLFDVVAAEAPPGVQDRPRRPLDGLVVEAVVVGEHDDKIGRLQFLRRAVHASDLRADVALDDVGIGGAHVRTHADQPIGDHDSR